MLGPTVRPLIERGAAAFLRHPLRRGGVPPRHLGPFWLPRGDAGTSWRGVLRVSERDAT